LKTSKIFSFSSFLIVNSSFWKIFANRGKKKKRAIDKQFNHMFVFWLGKWWHKSLKTINSQIDISDNGVMEHKLVFYLLTLETQGSKHT
jgi:hypothetical protein